MKFTLLAFLTLTGTIVPHLAFGQGMDTFQQLPFWDGSSSTSYIEALYKLAIAAAAVLVVLRLIWAGVQYMLSEVVTSKKQAKEDIQNALLGLVIILGAVTLLTTINPQLTNLNVIGTAEPIELTSANTGFSTNVRVGDEWREEEIGRVCALGVWRWRGTACFTDRMDYLRDSCLANGGSEFVYSNGVLGYSTYRCQ